VTKKQGSAAAVPAAAAANPAPPAEAAEVVKKVNKSEYLQNETEGTVRPSVFFFKRICGNMISSVIYFS